MSLALAATLAASMTLPSCSWDRPGANPFMGDVVAAVDRYTDIPGPVRAKLKARMEARQYDEIAAIRRDSITGKRKYAPEIRDMHFGQGQLCNTVTRARWSDDMLERGLVYCESGHCILVPTVCRNVSRIKRLGGDRVASAGDDPLLAPEELVARSGAGDGAGGGGGGGGGGLGDDGSAPMLALNAAPGAEGAEAASGGSASFEASSGLPAFTVSSLDIGGMLIPFSPPAAGKDGDAGIPWAVGAGPGGFNLGPVAGAGSLGALGGGGESGNAGTGGHNADSFGPAGPLPGVGGSGILGIGTLSRPPSDISVGEISPVPEPSTWLMALLGLAGVLVAARRR